MPNFESNGVYTGKQIIAEINNCLSLSDTGDRSMSSPLKFKKHFLIGDKSNIVTKEDYEFLKKELNRFTGLTPFPHGKGFKETYTTLVVGDGNSKENNRVEFEISVNPTMHNYFSFQNISTSITIGSIRIFKILDNGSRELVYQNKDGISEDVTRKEYLMLEKGKYLLEYSGRYNFNGFYAKYYYVKGELDDE